MEEMENFDKVITPKKRYSCTSEYATPKESDDSDSSFYFSFIESLESCIDDDVMNKENSVNAPLWTVSDTLNSPTVLRVPKAEAPLLRKVLQMNHTPRNKNNKRVSFSHSSKPCPTPTSTVKATKTKYSDTINSGESLPTASNKTQTEQKNEKKLEKDEEFNTNNDESVSSDVTDDLENELHSTIIENQSLGVNETLICNSKEHVTTIHVAPVSQSCTIAMSSDTIKFSESMEMHGPQNRLINDLGPKNGTQQLSNEITESNIRTIEEIIEEARKNMPQARKAAYIDRQHLAKDNRKSTMKATRSTTYKRRSSTYEPRKVASRKSLGVLKQNAKIAGGEC